MSFLRNILTALCGLGIVLAADQLRASEPAVVVSKPAASAQPQVANPTVLLARPLVIAPVVALPEATADCDAAELWVINSRHAPQCGDLDLGFTRLAFSRWQPATGSFQAEGLGTFLASGSHLPTLIFTHGNGLTHDEAMQNCWLLYRKIAGRAAGARIVFWSWASEQVYTRPLRRPIELAKKNVRTKYAYAENQGYYQAKLVEQLERGQAVTLGGHSLGCGVVASALHYLGGGVLNGRGLATTRTGRQENLRAVMLVAAFDNDVLKPGFRLSEALNVPESLYATFNPRDATLRRWTLLSARGRPAAGYSGINLASLGPDACRVSQESIADQLGREHGFAAHIANGRTVSKLCSLAFDESCTGPSE